jgi:type I restriction enzyme M protein
MCKKSPTPFHAWKQADGRQQIEERTPYQDTPGFCKAANLEDIKKHDYVLTPGRYVGAAALEDDGEAFEEKMAQLTVKLSSQFAESAQLENAIKEMLKSLGYAI